MKQALLTLPISFALTSTALAQLPPPTPGTSEWRFTGDTGVFVDKVSGPGTLEYADGDGAATDQLDLFTTTSTAGIPDIAGVDAPVMFFDYHTPSMGYKIRTLTGSANNDTWRFTLVFDVYVDAGNADGWLALWQGNASNLNDAELFLRPSSESIYQAGSGTVAAGSWSRGQWLRLVNVVDFPDAVANPGSADTGDIYIDGVLAFSGVAPDWFYDGQTNPCWILADENNETSQGYIANLAFTDTLLTPAEVAALGGAKASGVFDFNGPIGMNYCGPAIPNSTSFPATISANGSLLVAMNAVTLSADGLPPGQFGYFLAGQTQGFFNPPGSQGIICLSGNIGRYNNGADIIQGPMGSLQIDLGAIPVNPPTPVTAGETWSFQCWYRDVNPTGTSNFTDGLEITFM